MAWDAWALLSIIALCVAVMVWSGWGFYWDSRSDDSTFFRLRLAGGGFVDVPHRVGQRAGRHRSRGRR